MINRNNLSRLIMAGSNLHKRVNDLRFLNTPVNIVQLLIVILNLKL